MTTARRQYAEVAYVSVAVVAAAVVRFTNLDGVGLWLDEILGYDLATAATKLPLWRWIVGFDPEHGPLYYVTELAGRFTSNPEISARAVPVLLGTATIVIAWWVGRDKSFDRTTRFIFPVLLAFAPLHVYYSREGRPYALLMLLSTALLVRIRIGLLIAALYTSAVAAPLLLAVAIAAVIARHYRHAIAAAACLVAVPLLYRHAPWEPIGPQMSVGDPNFFVSLIHSLSVAAIDTTAHHRAAYVMLALAIAGAVALLIRDREKGLVVLTLAVVPAAIAISVLFAVHHWFSPRYVCVVLPAYLLLVSNGIAAIARQTRAAEFPVALLATAFLIREELPAARKEPMQKLDWRVVASAIWNHAKPGDAVIATSDWANVCTDFYLRRLPQRARLYKPNGSSTVAKIIAARAPATWIVSAGTDPQGDLGEWACSYPIVMEDSLESLRIHYAPSAAHFLAYRSSTAARRAVAAAQLSSSVALGLGPGDDVFLVKGWEGPEGREDYVRWIVGREASVFVPVTAQTIVMRVAPMEGRTPQQMTVFLNDRQLATFTLRRGWNEYTTAAPAMNGVLTFRFSRATAPADVANSTDRRPLSAMFSQIDFVDDAKALPAVQPMIRLDRLPRSERKTRFHPATWNRLAARQLLGRLGFDPDVVLPQLVRGTVTTEALAQTLAGELSCLDDAAFLVRTSEVLLGRKCPECGSAQIADRRHHEDRRRRAVDAILLSHEFRSMIGDKAE